MQVDQVGTPSSFEDAPAGAFIFFRLHDETLFGFKAIESVDDGDPILSCVAIPHPQGNGRPGLYDASVLSGYPVLVVPDALLLLSRAKEQWHPAAAVDRRAGDVLVTPDGALLVVLTGGNRLRSVDVRSGEIFHGRMPDATVVVHQWSIARPYFGKSEILYEYGKPATR